MSIRAMSILSLRNLKRKAVSNKHFATKVPPNNSNLHQASNPTQTQIRQVAVVLVTVL